MQKEQELTGDAVVVACGSYSAPLLRSVGVDLPIYPGKGYSATFPILRPEAAPCVSTIDDGRKIAMTRLGDTLRVAGTIELGGFDLALDTPLARARCPRPSALRARGPSGKSRPPGRPLTRRPRLMRWRSPPASSRRSTR